LSVTLRRFSLFHEKTPSSKSKDLFKKLLVTCARGRQGLCHTEELDHKTQVGDHPDRLNNLARVIFILAIDIV